ncbi:carbohydrate ABC transporter permease, partial [Streptomyces sp. SID7499]|nr:carbohydrate ABC transporter permease [Streptomyces sp. SID7499]
MKTTDTPPSGPSGAEATKVPAQRTGPVGKSPSAPA